jgi:hypothetical protein
MQPAEPALSVPLMHPQDLPDQTIVTCKFPNIFIYTLQHLYQEIDFDRLELISLGKAVRRARKVGEFLQTLKKKNYENSSRAGLRSSVRAYGFSRFQSFR